jgi:thioesterase domain-containing protein
LPGPEDGAYARREYEEPQGETEEQLAEIWKELLRVERVGRQDNFFELGGHSLLAVTFANILDQMGIRILVNDLFKYPTVRSLAGQIGLMRQRTPGDDAICIREGGRAHPLFLIHEGSGALLYASMLAPHLDANIPIYGLPAQPGDDALLRTVEGMARRLVHMIRAKQPLGPYRIAGWSFGGTLAYEVAAQLIGADQKVEFLGLIDTSYAAGTNNLPTSDAYEFNDKKQLLLLIQAHFSGEKQAGIDEAVANVARMEFTDLVRRCHQMSIMPKIFHRIAPIQLRRTLKYLYTFDWANRDYIASQIPIPVHLFIAQANSPACSRLGWDFVTLQNQLRIVSVPGNHQSMLASPNVEQLGRELSQAICGGEKEVSTELHESHYSALFKLQTGPYDKAPLFCVPGGGAGVTSFVELVASQTSAQPIYGLQPRGLDGVLLPHSTVTAAADCYVRTIEEMQPKGAVHLLGHSFGGWVVFEMAQRLLEIGRRTGSLTILDSDAPNDDVSAIREYSRSEGFMELVDTFEQLLERPLNIALSDLAPLSEAGQRDLLHARLVKAGLVPERSRPDMLRGQLQTFFMALRTPYRPDRKYLGPVHLVLVDDPRLDRDSNNRKQEELVLGWKQWAPNLVCSHAPGNHMTLLKRPHVITLRNLIQEKINVNIERKGAG